METVDQILAFKISFLISSNISKSSCCMKSFCCLFTLSPPLSYHGILVFFNMLNYFSKKISATFVSSALAIFKRVSVVVVVIAPLSSPEITVRDTPLFSANSHCDIFFSFLLSRILYPILFHLLMFNMLNFSFRISPLFKFVKYVEHFH